MKKYYASHVKGITSVVELEVEPLSKMECYTNNLNVFSLLADEVRYKIVKPNDYAKLYPYMLSSHLSNTKEEAVGKAQAAIIEDTQRNAEKSKVPIDWTALDKKIADIKTIDL